MDFLNNNKQNGRVGKSFSQSAKKLLQKKQVVEIFYREGPKTISELCEVTNNSIPSMAALINKLTSKGWVLSTGIGQSKGGRKPAVYGINPGAGLIATIELSRKDSRLCIFNLLNKKVCEVAEVSDGLDTNKNILTVLKRELDRLMAANGIKKSDILGLGVTIPGLIDIKTGVSYSYPLFGDKPLNEVFEEKFGLTTVIEHDTKAMALGEAWFGLAREIPNVLFVNIGSGIGLGIIINGQLYHGHSGFSGEFGHIQMNPEGQLCYCGKIGCLETIASGTALVKKSKEMIMQGKSTMMTNLVDNNADNIKLKTIIDGAFKGDLFAIELIEEAGEYLAKGLSVLIHLFNPEAIIIGGEMAEAGNLITDPVQQKLNKYTMLRLKTDTRILLSDLKQEAGLYGVLTIAVDRVFNKIFN